MLLSHRLLKPAIVQIGIGRGVVVTEGGSGNECDTTCKRSQDRIPQEAPPDGPGIF